MTSAQQTTNSDLVHAEQTTRADTGTLQEQSQGAQPLNLAPSVSGREVGLSQNPPTHNQYSELGDDSRELMEDIQRTIDSVHTRSHSSNPETTNNRPTNTKGLKVELKRLHQSEFLGVGNDQPTSHVRKKYPSTETTRANFLAAVSLTSEALQEFNQIQESVYQTQEPDSPPTPELKAKIRELVHSKTILMKSFESLSYALQRGGISSERNEHHATMVSLVTQIDTIREEYRDVMSETSSFFTSRSIDNAGSRRSESRRDANYQQTLIVQQKSIELES